MRDVAIIGVGISKFGEQWEKSLREIGIEAGVMAINDAGITGNDVEELFIGISSSANFASQEHIAPLIADQVGLAKWNVPSTRIEAADASGGVALRQGFLSVASGMNDIVVVGGAEKMSDLTSTEMTDVMASTADQEWEAFFGATLPSLYAMMARRHMYEYGTTREQIAHVAVKNHRNGALNPMAQYRKEVTLDRVIGADMVADPLTMFDCAPISDGAAAVVLASVDKAKKFTDHFIKISGSGQGSDRLSLQERASLTTMESTKKAARDAFEMAEKKPDDIDVAEVHDSYTIGEIMAIEDIGFFEKGKGGGAVGHELTGLHGKIPVNPSGGLKARGHPLGATGIAQVVEITLQLRGAADRRQVKGAEVGLTQNIGGTGATAVVHILEVI